MTDFAWPTAVTEQAVRDAGWTPDRRVDIDEWISALTGQGYYFSPAALTVLRSFGGLVIVPPRVPEATWASDPIEFDPMETGDGMYERYRQQEMALGARMSPLATRGGESAVLMLNDGRVVGDSSFGVQLLGTTFPEALDLLLRRPYRPAFLLDYRK